MLAPPGIQDKQKWENIYLALIAMLSKIATSRIKKWNVKKETSKMDFPTLEKEVFQREEFYYNKISPKNKKFHLSIPPRLYIRLHLNYT